MILFARWCSLNVFAVSDIIDLRSSFQKLTLSHQLLEFNDSQTLDSSDSSYNDATVRNELKQRSLQSTLKFLSIILIAFSSVANELFTKNCASTSNAQLNSRHCTQTSFYDLFDLKIHRTIRSICSINRCCFSKIE